MNEIVNSILLAGDKFKAAVHSDLHIVLLDHLQKKNECKN